MTDRQKILKDPHVGAFAVISLAALFLLSFALCLSLPEGAELTALIFAPVCVRCVSALCVENLNPLRHSQYGEGFDRSRKAEHNRILSSFLLLGLGSAFAAGGLEGLLPSLGASAVCFLSILYAREQLGGMSGDAAGYGTVLGEAAALAALLIVN